MRTLMTTILFLSVGLIPAIAQYYPCGRCFDYTTSGSNVTLDFSHVETVSCDGLEYYLSYYPVGSPGNEQILQTFANLPPSATYTGDPGEYVICFGYSCEGTLGLVSGEPLLTTELCCVVVSFGNPCNEPPICHFKINPNVTFNAGNYISTFNANTSSDVDYYAWEWGDYTNQINTTAITQHAYSGIFPDAYPEVNVCLTGSNACGMSRYCCTYYTFGDANDYYSWCDLPFSIYSPPEITPEMEGSSVSLDLSDFACGTGADVFFDPGDGSGEILANGCNTISHTYDGEGPYNCCVRIYFPCISICFCFPFRPAPRFDCVDAYELYCNTYGNEVVQDANDPILHQGFSPIFDNWEGYGDCLGIDDGCDNQNIINTTQNFSAHEVIYKVENPSIDGDNDLVIDVVPLDAGLDVDLFVMEDCFTYWPGYVSVLEGCAGSSTYPAGIRDAVLIEDAISTQYYMVVDGGPGSNDQEGRFELAVTCGDLCTKDARSFLQCGKSVIDSTTNFTTDNQASYYCGCDNDNGSARAGNYGPENIHILDVIDTAAVVIDLEILSQGKDLELYLLKECDVKSCVRNSRNAPGVNERIEKLLVPGRYYVIVEGFRGQTGKYRLTVNGCRCALECNGGAIVFSEDFENFAPGTLIPNAFTPEWNFGSYVPNDPFDNSLAAIVLERTNQNNKLVLNSATHNYSDVSHSLPLDTTGVHRLNIDVTLKYTSNKLDNGIISVFESRNLLDATYHHELRLRYGHDVSGKNFANLYLYSSEGGLGGSFTDSVKLASITPFLSAPSGTQFKSFTLSYIFDIDKGLVTLLVDNVCTYTGQFYLAQSTFVLSRGVEFITAKSPSYMEIDNIRYERCGDCDEIEEEDCEHIIITGMGGNDELMSMSFDAPDIDPKTFLGWQVIDETVNETYELETGFWPGFRPGHTCRICVRYRDANGCIRECCITVQIPAGCTLVSSHHIGAQNELLFEFEADDADLVPVLFMNQENGTSNTTGIFSFQSPGNYHICCLYYHPVLKVYILCCRHFCIDYPWSCGPLFTYTVNQGSTTSTVLFSRNSPQADTYLWDFGDGSTSTSAGTSVSHTYPGGTRSYIVCLTIWDDCKGYCTYCIEIFLGDPLILHIDDACGTVGQTVQMPITVGNFTSLVTGSFTIKLNTTGAKLVGIDNNGLTSVFIGTVLDDQTVVVNWADVQSAPLTLPDFTKIATLRAQITSASFTSAPVSFSNDPVLVKFTGADNMPVPVSTDNGTLCRVQQVSIAGQINTAGPTNQPMPSVVVWRRGQSDVSVLTDAMGKYSVAAEVGMNYTISPEKNTGFLNGINPLDLVLVLRHVSFVERFTDPKKWLAADVDRNGSVEILDYKIINDLLLGKILAFPGGKSWRFLPANYVFQNPVNPLPENAPESLFYQPLQQTVANANFTGIKLGDINFSASPSPNVNSVETRNACDVFEVLDRTLTQGEMINVQFQAREFTDVFTFLFELKLDTTILEYVSFVSSALPGFTDAQISTTFIEEGYLHALWVEPQGLGSSLSDDGNVMTLRFKVKNDGSTLRDALEVTSVHRTSEIIFTTFESNCLDVEFYGTVSAQNVQASILDMRAWPNPFSDHVNLEFTYDREAKAILRIFNTMGQVVYETEVQLSQGSAVLTLDDRVLHGSAGMLMAQLQTGQESAVIPLISYRE